MSMMVIMGSTQSHSRTNSSVRLHTLARGKDADNWAVLTSTPRKDVPHHGPVTDLYDCGITTMPQTLVLLLLPPLVVPLIESPLVRCYGSIALVKSNGFKASISRETV